MTKKIYRKKTFGNEEVEYETEHEYEAWLARKNAIEALKEVRKGLKFIDSKVFDNLVDLESTDSLKRSYEILSKTILLLSSNVMSNLNIPNVSTAQADLLVAALEAVKSKHKETDK